MGGHCCWHCATGQASWHSTGLAHTVMAVVVAQLLHLASLSPAPSSLFVNNGAEKIAAEMPLSSALCCLNASTPEVPARVRHKGCWEGRKGQGSLVWLWGPLLPPSLDDSLFWGEVTQMGSEPHGWHRCAPTAWPFPGSISLVGSAPEGYALWGQL